MTDIESDLLADGWQTDGAGSWWREVEPSQKYNVEQAAEIYRAWVQDEVEDYG